VTSQEGALHDKAQQVTTSELQWRSLAAYGFMAFPLAFAGLPLYLHAPDFYATTLAVPLSALGLVLLALRVIDALQDPLIGSLSDAYSEKRGAILLSGMILLGSGFWMVFHPLAAAPLLWFAFSIFLCTTGFSVVAINLQALGGLWTTHESNRTRITGVREAFGLLGLLCAAITPSLLGHTIDPATSFHLLASLFLPLLALGGLLLMLWLKTAPLMSATQKSEKSINWATLLNTPWRRQFFALNLLNTFASAIPAVLVLFFIRDRLGEESLTGLFLLLYFLSGALSMVIWDKFATRYGKVTTWGSSMALACVTFIWASLLGPGDGMAYGIICLLSGLALGADLAIPPAILADHIAGSRQQADTSRLFSVLTFISKSALALATGVALPFLGLLGYQPGTIATGETAVALSLAYAGGPCLLKAVAFGWVLKARQTLETR